MGDTHNMGNSQQGERDRQYSGGNTPGVFGMVLCVDICAVLLLTGVQPLGSALRPSSHAST